MDLTSTERATIKDVVYAGRPTASQAEAEAGTNPDKAMTPLTTSQAIAAQAATTAQGALADSAVQPGDLAQVATSGDYNDLTNLPSLSADLIYPVKADAAAAIVPFSSNSLKLNGDVTEGDGLGGLYIDTNNGSTDTFVSSGGTSRTWYRAADVGTARISGGIVPFETEAAFVAAKIPLLLMFVETSGYYAAGDGGGHKKVRIATPSPAKAWHKQSADGAWWQIAPDEIRPEIFGARGGALRAADGGITSGTSVFASASSAFTLADVGKAIVIKGAGAAGANLSTTIAGFTNATTVTITASASTTVAAADWCYGHNDRQAIADAAAFLASLGGGQIDLLRRAYLILSSVPLPSNVRVSGRGIGASAILHPTSHCWKNDDTTNGNRNITVTDMTLDACRMFDGSVSMSGIRRLYCERLEVVNPKDRGVTVGIGVAAIAGFETADVHVTDCTFNVPDYGVVLDSTSGLGAIKHFSVIGCTFTIGWGSAVSVAGNVKEGVIANNKIFLPGTGPGTGTGGAGDPINSPNIGIGVKIWAGTSASVCPETITVIGNTIVGTSSKVEMLGVTVSDFSNNITVSANSFDQMTNAVRNDFNSNARGLAVSNNTVKRSNYGIYNITSSDFRTVVNGNTFEDCVFGLHGTFRSSPISGNRFANIGEDAMVLLSPSRNAAITGNTGDSIGKSFIRQTGTGANTSLLLISGNNVQNCGTLANNTYDVLDLSDQSHSVTGNMFVNEAANKPRYIIGGAGTHRIVSDNWLFGAGTGYYETAAAGTDKFDNNLERGL